MSQSRGGARERCALRLLLSSDLLRALRAVVDVPPADCFKRLSPEYFRFGLTCIVTTALRVLLGAIALSQSYALPAAPDYGNTQEDERLVCNTEKQGELDSLVVKKLAFYAQAFPEILFVALPAGDAWLDSFLTLVVLLGDHATDLDYEHPSHAREDLLYVAKARVQAMLRAGESSSSLFRVGADGLAKRENLCAITVNPCGVAKDDDVATWHLLEDLGPDRTPDVVLQERHLDYRHHLEYVLDSHAEHILRF